MNLDKGSIYAGAGQDWSFKDRAHSGTRVAWALLLGNACWNREGSCPFPKVKTEEKLVCSWNVFGGDLLALDFSNVDVTMLVWSTNKFSVVLGRSKPESTLVYLHILKDCTAEYTPGGCLSTVRNIVHKIWTQFLQILRFMTRNIWKVILVHHLSLPCRFFCSFLDGILTVKSLRSWFLSW